MSPKEWKALTLTLALLRKEFEALTEELEQVSAWGQGWVRVVVRDRVRLAEVLGQISAWGQVGRGNL